MKITYIKRIVTLVILLMAGPLANAQNTESKTPEERARFQTEWMKRKLGLNETQQNQVETINLKYAQKNEPVLKSKERRITKLKKLKSIQGEKDAELKTVLSPEQHEKYQVLVEEMKEKVKERRG